MMTHYCNEFKLSVSTLYNWRIQAKRQRSSDEIDATKEVIDRCQNSGFEVLGIGIDTDKVKSLFAHHVVISDVCQLKEEVFKVAGAWLA